MAMLRGAIVNESAAEQLRSFIQSRVLEGTRARADKDAALRAGLASSMLVGVVTSRQIIGVPALLTAGTDQLVTVLAPAIQQILVPQPSADAKLLSVEGGGREPAPIPSREVIAGFVR